MKLGMGIMNIEPPNSNSFYEEENIPCFNKKEIWKIIKNDSKVIPFSLTFRFHRHSSIRSKSANLYNLFVLSLIVCLIISINSRLLAQDFQVTTNGTALFSPNIATDSSGNFTIVWDDGRNIKIPFGGSGTNGDIYGQRYDSRGIPIGENFRISDDSLDNNISFASQIFPRVAMNKAGKFVVTWVDTRPKGTPSDPTVPTEFNIYAQRFDSNGNPIGSNFLVSDIGGGQLNPDIIIRDDGSFVIIWINTLDGIGGINTIFRIHLQAFDSEGKRIGPNQKLNLYAQQPRIALFPESNFVIVADSNAQIFSFPSNEIGSTFWISKGYTREAKISKDNIIYITQMEDRIVKDPNGDYLDSDIFIQAYDTLGKLVINKFKVNDDNTNYWQVNPTLSIDNDHIFVAWEDYRNGYQIGEGNCKDIYGQRFNLNFTRIGSNFKVSHENDESEQFYPTTALINDTIYITWFDWRSWEFYTNIYPPQPKIDVWATIQDFNNPIEGNPVRCTPPSSQVPISFVFFQSFPNPTNLSSTFVYDLPEDAYVKLTLYNILGKEVKVLINEFQSVSRYSRDFIINNLASGIYFARLTAATTSGSTLTSTIKFVLVK